MGFITIPMHSEPIDPTTPKQRRKGVGHGMHPATSSLKAAWRSVLTSPQGSVVQDLTNFYESWKRVVSCPYPPVQGNFKSPNPWSYTITDSTSMTGEHIVWNTVLGSIQVTSGNIGRGNLAPSPPDTSSAVNNAINGAISRLNEKVRGSLDLATSLAETGQAFKMLNLVGRFESGVVDMRRSYDREILKKIRSFRSRRGLARALRNWQRDLRSRYPGAYRPVPVTPGLVSRVSSLGANGWCEYTYGWNPLISDIRGVAENIVGFVRNNDKVSGKYTLRLNNTTAAPDFDMQNGWVYPSTYTDEGFVMAKFNIKLSNGWDPGLAKWSSLNPLAVAWELTPYSFVIDWFLDIGDYMRNLESALLFNSKFVSGSRSVLIKVQRSRKVQAVKNNANAKTICNGSNAYSYTNFTRSILTFYPTPYLPSFKADLGSSRLISAAALLRQLIRK
jgi:hypothetical protein